jgi:RNA polymerase sigma factor (sigma-70 family)
MRSQRLRHPARLAGASLMRLQSDDRLAELAVDGHEAAFAAIVDRYRTPLLRYCAGIVGADRAEDAVQQALISAHDALTRTDEVRHLRSWLYRIAHNTALNVLRAVRDDVPLDPAHAAAAGDGPAASFERGERLRATLAAVGQLPERQRAALVLRELEGRSHEEIADALGVTKGSARQHLMRARTAVRGAVTAITPYPLLARLAETLASHGGAGWADAVVGAGAGVTLAKLTAGVVATGALVGGAVGTEHAVHRHHRTIESSRKTDAAARTTPAVAPAQAVAAEASTSRVRETTASRAGPPKARDTTGGVSRRGSTDDNNDDHSGKGSGRGGAVSVGGSSGDDDRPSARRRDDTDHSGSSGRGKGSGRHEDDDPIVDHAKSDSGKGSSGSTGSSDDERGSEPGGGSSSGEKASEDSKSSSSGKGSSDEPSSATVTTPAPPPPAEAADDSHAAGSPTSGSPTSGSPTSGSPASASDGD